MANIHTHLKEFRIAKGFTQEEVADKIGLTRQAISGYESGKREPGIDILMKLAEIYEVDIEHILYGKRDTTREKNRVKRLAITVAVMFFVLQMLTGLLLTMSFVVYPLAEGPIAQEDMPKVEQHFALSNLSELTERAASIVLSLGSIIVVILDCSCKNTFSWKRKLGFYLCILGISWLIAIVWSVVHPIFGAVDFITRGPIYFVNVTLFLLLDLAYCGANKGKSR